MYTSNIEYNRNLHKEIKKEALCRASDLLPEKRRRLTEAYLETIKGIISCEEGYNFDVYSYSDNLNMSKSKEEISTILTNIYEMLIFNKKSVKFRSSNKS